MNRNKWFNALLMVLAFWAIGAAGAQARRVVRVLAIGNSFSEDAVEQNLYELGAARDIDIIIGNLYIAGCSLERHWLNAQRDSAAYRYRKIGWDGRTIEVKNTRISYALHDEEWDFVTLQQASGLSGQYLSYQPYMDSLQAYVDSICPDAKMLWHQTWAYAANSTHKDFKRYDNDQYYMYESIITASRKAVKEGDFKDVIPSGTAIQNARTSVLGDTMCRDGYHLNLVWGRYIAACTWFEVLTGKNVMGNSYFPRGMDPRLVYMTQKSAHNAVRHPWRVTSFHGGQW